jgi:hypothetical protein
VFLMRFEIQESDLLSVQWTSIPGAYYSAVKFDCKTARRTALPQKEVSQARGSREDGQGVASGVCAS